MKPSQLIFSFLISTWLSCHELFYMMFELYMGCSKKVAPSELLLNRITSY